MATLSMARVFAVPRKARRQVQPKPGQDVIEAMAAPWLGQREAGHVAGKNEGDLGDAGTSLCRECFGECYG